jgi:hypothetical protein
MERKKRKKNQSYIHKRTKIYQLLIQKPIFANNELLYYGYDTRKFQLFNILTIQEQCTFLSFSFPLFPLFFSCVRLVNNGKLGATPFSSGYFFLVY